MSAAALLTPGALLRTAARSKDFRRAAWLGLLALALRVAFAVAVQRHAYPPTDQPDTALRSQLAALGLFNDAFFYHRAAELLASGHGFSAAIGVPTAQWPPAFPTLLSLVYRVAGPHPVAGQVFNACLGALTVPLLYLLAKRTFGRSEATIAAGALAVLPGQILWSDVELSETLYTLLLVGFFLLVQVLPRRAWSAAALGVAAGIVILTRGDGILLLPALVAVWWPELRRRRLAAWTGTAIACAALTVAPWTIRNAVVMGAFIPLSTNSSTTLWSGHNPNADGAQNYAPPSLLAHIAVHGKEHEIEEARLLRRKAFEFMRTHPARELELIPLKLINLNRGDASALQWVDAGPPGDTPIPAELETPVTVVADSAYYALLAATLLGIVLSGRALWRRRTTRGVLILFAGALVLYGFVYYGNYRYRAPLEPLMLLVAAPLLAGLWRRRGRLAPEP